MASAWEPQPAEEEVVSMASTLLLVIWLVLSGMVGKEGIYCIYVYIYIYPLG